MTAALLFLALAALVGTILYLIFQPELAAFHAETLTEARGRHGRHVLRARIVADLAHPDGTAADLPLSEAVPLTPYALAPVLYGQRGANPYPADTRTDLPAIPAVRPYAALAPVRADCPSSPTGGHCCHNDGGTWKCCLPGCPR